MFEGPYIAVGRIKKPFGSIPVLRAIIYDSFLDFVLKQRFLFLEHDGLFVPYCIKNIETHRSYYSIQLEEIESLEKAQKLKSKELFMQEKLVPKESLTPPSDLRFSELIGYNIETTEGIKGRILKVESFPQQEMATVEIDEKTHLIPLNADFLQSVDHRTKNVILALPKGLIEL